MLHITTTDNNCGKNVFEISRGYDFSLSHCAELSRIANIPLKEFVVKNKNLLVFPSGIEKSYGRIDDLKIFKMSGSGENLRDVKIKTGNLMGFVGTGETQIEITSRFANGENDFFLHYMLAKVFCPNLIDLKFDSSFGGIFDFLYFLFPFYLKKAMRQGIFKTYRAFERNDANARGAINVPRHIQKNIPFAGKIAYTERTRDFDNPLTELVRHTIERIKTKQFASKILAADSDTKSAAGQIVEATPSYNLFAREKIIFQNSKPVNHPYFTEWRPLQKLCLAILRREKINYHKDSKSVYGLLFDGAWLWEEYLSTILKPRGFIHPKNKESRGGFRIFDNDNDENADANFNKDFRRIYPDFYKAGEVILDAKYKRLEQGVGREDVYQVVSYMHTMSKKDGNVLNGGFIFPCKEDFENKRYKLAGLGGTIDVVGFTIPQNTGSFKTFSREIEKEEKKLASQF